MTECYQCMDKGLLVIPKQGTTGLAYDFMFQCTCQKGHYYKQLPPLDIKVPENREILKRLANENYEMEKNSVKREGVKN